MKERTLKQLVGALAVVAALWAVFTLLSGRGDGGGAIAATGRIAAVFDGVDAGSVGAVRLTRPEGDLEIVSIGGGWTVNGFAADSGAIARFLEVVGEARIGDLVASNPGNHARMGVSADSARALEMDVAGGTRTLLVGKEGPRAGTSYARLPDEDEVYLLEASLQSYLGRALDNWRNRRMVAIDTSRVTRIAVRRDGATAELARGEGGWSFADGSEAVADQVQEILGQLGGGLVASRFVYDDDPIAEVEAGGGTVAYSVSGEVLAEVTIGGGSGDRWATAAGDSVRYRLPSFRVDMITPEPESLRPES